MKTAHICKRSESRSAFTLIEMLVVIAIIALLASILIPAVNGSIARARSVACLSNLRQMGMAFTMYATQKEGRFPAANEENNTPWFVAISPFLQENAGNAEDLQEVFRCPIYAQINPEYQDSTDWRQLGYGMNIFLAGSPTTGWPFTGEASKYAYFLHQIVNPSGTILLADENSWSWGIHGSSYASSLTSGYFAEDRWGKERGHRHGKGANFLFVDGHVGSLNAETIEPYLLQ